jgi:hypothetical protein
MGGPHHRDKNAQGRRGVTWVGSTMLEGMVGGSWSSTMLEGEHYSTWNVIKFQNYIFGSKIYENIKLL